MIRVGYDDFDPSCSALKVTTTFGKVTCVGEERISTGSATPPPRGTGAPCSVPKYWDHLRTRIHFDIERPGHVTPPFQQAGPQRPQNVWRPYLYTPIRFGLERQNSVPQHVGKHAFTRSATRPPNAGPSVPKILGISYMRTHKMRHSNANQILHDDQTRCEEIFTWSTTPPALAIDTNGVELSVSGS